MFVFFGILFYDMIYTALLDTPHTLHSIYYSMYVIFSLNSFYLIPSSVSLLSLVPARLYTTPSSIAQSLVQQSTQLTPLAFLVTQISLLMSICIDINTVFIVVIIPG